LLEEVEEDEEEDFFRLSCFCRIGGDGWNALMRGGASGAVDWADDGREFILRWEKGFLCKNFVVATRL